MKNVPLKIYLQVDADGETPDDFNELAVSWCSNKVNDNDIEYLLAPTQNPMLCAVSHKDVSVMFLEWTEQKYWRTAKRVGHKWFKLNSAEPLIDSTADLFDIFIKEMEEELSALELSAFYSNLEKEDNPPDALTAEEKEYLKTITNAKE